MFSRMPICRWTCAIRPMVSMSFCAGCIVSERPCFSSEHDKEFENMPPMSEDVATLLAPMIKKPLWVVLTTAQVPSAEMEPHAPEHLRYMNELEEQGVLWPS